MVQRINMDVCIKIRHTNNHHVALQTKMALLGGLFTIPCIKPESTLCTRTATQPKMGAWTVWHLSRRRVCTKTEHGRSSKGNKFNREGEANGVQPHAAFHLRDISGKREARPSQRPVIISLHRHTCPNEDTQEAICIPYLLIVG